MSPATASLCALLLAIAVSCTSRINVGLWRSRALDVWP